MEDTLNKVDTPGESPAPARPHYANIGSTVPNPIMKFFNYTHLPLRLQVVARYFHGIAHSLNDSTPDSAEKSAGLRKLLEAKDCFVRAAME